MVELVRRDEVDRLPEPEDITLMGDPLPFYRLHAFDASAPARLRLIAHLVREAGSGRP